MAGSAEGYQGQGPLPLDGNPDAAGGAEECRHCQKAPLDEAEELAVLNREFKRRQESLADYRRAGRPELVEQLEQEMALIKSYLPEQLTEEELAEMVRQAIQESGAASMKDLGKVMRLLMPRVKGRADGNRVRQAVEEQISQL